MSPGIDSRAGPLTGMARAGPRRARNRTHSAVGRTHFKVILAGILERVRDSINREQHGSQERVWLAFGTETVQQLQLHE